MMKKSLITGIIVAAVLAVASTITILVIVHHSKRQDSPNGDSSSTNSPGSGSAAGTPTTANNVSSSVPTTAMPTTALPLQIGPKRVVGYVVASNSVNTTLAQIDWTAVTVIIAAFLQPTADGSAFIITPYLQKIISTAQANNVSAFISIGGGSAPPIWNTLMSESVRDRAIGQIVDAAKQLGADGIDVDIEGTFVSNPDTDYNGFVSRIFTAARAAKLQVSGCVEKYVVSSVSDDVLSGFDFIMAMAYNYKGPWNTKPPLSMFSSYDVAVNELEYYTVNRSVQMTKIVLGVVFSGYDFTDVNNVQLVTWNQLVANHPEAIYNDTVANIYYNGIATMKQKAVLSLPFGGMMVWQLVFDVPGPNSLLGAIKSVYSNHSITPVAF